MADKPERKRWTGSTVAWIVAVVLVLIGGNRSSGKAESKLDSPVAAAMSWLPDDCETVFVARGPFAVRNRAQDPAREGKPPTFEAILQSVPLRLARELGNGVLVNELNGQRVILAVEGSRKFRGPKGLGLMPYEGCQIVFFDKTSDAVLQRAFEACRQRADKRLNYRSHVVAQFTQKLESDEWTIFITRPQAGVLLCATDEKFLNEVLDRIETPAKTRALPDDLPEWKQVDVRAPFWAVRHYRLADAATDPSSPLRSEAPANIPDSKAIGFVSWYDPKSAELKARYLSDSPEAKKLVEKGWTSPGDKLEPRITQIAPGVIEMAAPVSDKQVARLCAWVLMGYLGHAIFL